MLLIRLGMKNKGMMICNISKIDPRFNKKKLLSYKLYMESLPIYAHIWSYYLIKCRPELDDLVISKVQVILDTLHIP